MDNGVVIRLLADLGMDELSYKALALLPLVQVAWADGRVQAKEALVIEHVADDTWEVGTEATLLLRNWLRYRPTDAYLERGRTALLAVVASGSEPDLDEAVLDDVLTLSRTVARAAGGLFGMGAISRSEAAAINSIAAALNIEPGTALSRAATELASGPASPAPRRVTITFSSTTTLATAAQGGVLQADPALGRSDKIAVDRSGVAIGAAETADLCVEHDPDMAAMHARVFERNRKFYVEDLESETGTFVNDERIAERRLLGGEVLRMGHVSLTFKRLRTIPKQMIE